MDQVSANSEISAGALLLSRLKALGIDYIFANSGTDFPPIIEGLAEAEANDMPLPKALIMPHEHAAMGMAHGYYLATGKAQAVIAHTNVGLANCTIGAINAATEHIPVFLMSGRTPVTEEGRLGSRTVPIGWGQEMRDQHALIREACKWDYELRFPEQVNEVVDRAYAIANSTPKGPVYLSLPREVLCQTCAPADRDADHLMVPVTAAPPNSEIHRAAEILAKAKRPMIIAQRGAGSPEGFRVLGELADKWGIPVIQYWAIQLAIATDGAMAAGSDPGPFIGDADAILVIDSLAPWSPEIHKLRDDCKVIHMAPDPLYSRFPVRNFRADIALAGELEPAIIELARSMESHYSSDVCGNRRNQVLKKTETIQKQIRENAMEGKDGLMSKAWVSHCLSEAIAGRSATVLSELGCPLDPLVLREHGSWYQEPHSGGLGWSFPAGLGMQLADPDRLIVATMGDGSYIFSNPVACHQIAESLGLPILVLVLNNREWSAVRRSVLGVYPKGYAARTNTVPLTSLDPTPDFTKVAAASRAWTASVERGEDLPSVLAAAVKEVARNRRQALVEIRIAP
jgi:acetolactate synthase-1/2/3 large subunit